LEEPFTFLLIQLIAWLIMGVICSVIARNRGRNPLGWFFIGLVGGCIGLILVLVLPDLNKEQEILDKERRRRRRVEEELAQERMKNQAFRGHASNRLDAHDDALGVDTRTAAASMLPPPSVPEAQEDGVPSEGWYLATPGSEAEGPLSLADVRERIRGDQVAGKTLVWHETLEDWTKVESSPLHIFLS